MREVGIRQMRQIADAASHTSLAAADSCSEPHQSAVWEGLGRRCLPEIAGSCLGTGSCLLLGWLARIYSSSSELGAGSLVPWGRSSLTWCPSWQRLFHCWSQILECSLVSVESPQWWLKSRKTNQTSASFSCCVVGAGKDPLCVSSGCLA